MEHAACILRLSKHLIRCVNIIRVVNVEFYVNLTKMLECIAMMKVEKSNAKQQKRQKPSSLFDYFMDLFKKIESVE